MTTPAPPTRVLVVDDDPASSSSLALQLTQLGWEVREAATVRAALAALRQRPATLVISDSGMPDGDGVSFLSRVMSEHPDSVRVFYSGKPQTDEVREALARGVASHHFVKGQDLRRVLALARRIAAGAPATPVPTKGPQTRAFDLVWRGFRARLAPGVWTIGRSLTTNLKIPDDQMSREHAALYVTGDLVLLEDRESLNGTFVNGQRITGRVPLTPGDRFRLGATDFHLEAREPQIVLGGSAGEAVKDRVRSPAEFDDDEPTRVGDLPRRPSRPIPIDGVHRALAEREAMELTARTPTIPPFGPEAQTVLAVLRDGTWAEQIVRAAFIHQDMQLELRKPDQAARVVDAITDGLLLLDVDAAGTGRDSLLSAWRASPTRGPVLLTGTLADAEGAALARKLGAAGYFQSGRSPILVVGLLRMHLKRR